MTLMNPAQNLVKKFLNYIWSKDAVSWIVSPVSDEVAKVTVAIFKHQVDFINLWNDIQKLN
tara:strand:+ start:382 stop:564 length:183 start_codon:yes stop_codon:yes gene_type:complete